MIPATVACHYPFAAVNIGPGGDVWFCCPEWTTGAALTRLGNLREGSLQALWNGPVAQAIRAAMYADRIESWCRSPGCPILNGGQRLAVADPAVHARGELLADATLGEIARGETVLTSFPSYVVISNDWRCNLRCVMCSTTSFVARYGNRDPVVAGVTEQLFDELEANAEALRRVFLSGYGDPFSIRRHLRFLRETTRRHRVEIELLTNGQLLSPRMWETIAHNRFYTIRVSVDATREATYRAIRKRGSWNRLLRNLRFLGELRRAGDLPAFEINMTVMRENYREVYDFLDFGLELGGDCVGRQLIHGDLGGQNFLEPTVDWDIVRYLQAFLASETAAHPRYYTDFLGHLVGLQPPAVSAGSSP
ncbi:MAG: radical SAM protein [Pseudomonadota bacterium]